MTTVVDPFATQQRMDDSAARLADGRKRLDDGQRELNKGGDKVVQGGIPINPRPHDHITRPRERAAQMRSARAPAPRLSRDGASR